MTDFPEWVDGPKFVAWISEVRPDYRIELEPHLTRTMRRLDVPGTKGKVDTIDRICCALFLHISEIPDEVWTFETPNRGRRVNSKRRAEARAMIADGVAPGEVARRLRVGYRTIRSWVKDEAA